MAQRERAGALTDADVADVTEAAEDLGQRLVQALAEATGRDASEFDIDSDSYDLPTPRANDEP